MNYLCAAFVTMWLIYFAYLLFLNLKTDRLKRSVEAFKKETARTYDS